MHGWGRGLREGGGGKTSSLGFGGGVHTGGEVEGGASLVSWEGGWGTYRC